MQLPPQAASVYTDWWQLVSYAASTPSPVTGQFYSAADLSAAAAEISAAEGRPLGFAGYTGLTQLYGIARNIEVSAANLTAADDSASLDASMISEAPWSDAGAISAGINRWQLRAEITYTDPEGNTLTGWSTGIFQSVLPATVGDLRAEAQLQFQRMLSSPAPGTPRTGTLLSIGTTYLMQV